MNQYIQTGIDKLFFIPHHDAGAAAAEKIENFYEIKHVRPDDNRLAVRRRLQDIMAADMGQAAADEDQIAQAVHPAQLADRIEEDAVVWAGNLLSRYHVAAFDHRHAVLDAFVVNEVGLMNVARRYDELRSGEMVPYIAERLVYRHVFPLMGAAGNHDGIGVFVESQLLEVAFLFFIRHDAVGLVVLRIARDDDLIGVGADIDDILGIDAALHAEHVNRRQDAARKEGNHAVPAGATAADAPVHHHDGNILAGRDAQEVRPDFRLDEDNGPRLDDGQNAVCQVRQVQREI